jgi:hypothetical protein
LDACAILREIAAKPAPDEALVNARDASECIDHLRPSADGPERVEEHPA